MQVELPSLADALQATPGCMFQAAVQASGNTRMEGVVFIASRPDGVNTGVLCSVVIHPRWDLIPPQVWCHESWFRRGNADWHSYRDGGLCWELADRWRAHLANLLYLVPITTITRHAAEYLLNSVRSLLERHLTGHRLGLVEWPPEWKYWAHGDAGLRQFLQSAKS